jgi:hypothetical protein
MFTELLKFNAFWRRRHQRKLRNEWQHGFMVGIGYRLFPNDLEAILPEPVTEQRRAESDAFDEGYQVAMSCPLAVSIPESFAKMYGVKA